MPQQEVRTREDLRAFAVMLRKFSGGNRNIPGEDLLKGLADPQTAPGDD